MTFFKFIHASLKHGLVDPYTGSLIPNDEFGIIHTCNHEDVLHWAQALESTYKDSPFHLEVGEKIYVAKITVDDNTVVEVVKNARILSGSNTVNILAKEVGDIGGRLKDIRLKETDVISVSYVECCGEELKVALRINLHNIDDMNHNDGLCQVEEGFNSLQWIENGVSMKIDTILDRVRPHTNLYPLSNKPTCVADLCLGLYIGENVEVTQYNVLRSTFSDGYQYDRDTLAHNLDALSFDDETVYRFCKRRTDHQAFYKLEVKDLPLNKRILLVVLFKEYVKMGMGFDDVFDNIVNMYIDM